MAEPTRYKPERNLAAQWAVISRDILPTGLGPYEVELARVAFHGGAAAVLDIIQDLGADDAVGPDAAAFVLEMLREKIREWIGEVKARKGGAGG